MNGERTCLCARGVESVSSCEEVAARTIEIVTEPQYEDIDLTEDQPMLSANFEQTEDGFIEDELFAMSP